ncbi:MAG: RagB/SusD family nutrient uptake outer membrane protein [Bacteroidales bacterium]|nr:RagB/SusD family nutrient uptake outer membrane protein [Bacteroidales bacterium]
MLKTIIQTPDGVEALLVGVYERMQNGSSMFGGAMTSDWTYAAGCSDDCYKGTSTGDQSNFNLLERYEALPNNPYLDNRWTQCYDGVARANVTLQFLWQTQAGSSSLDAGRAKEVEAEAKFLRAWFHMQANKIFEKIPYVKTREELGDLAPEEVPNTDAGWDGIKPTFSMLSTTCPSLNTIRKLVARTSMLPWLSKPRLTCTRKSILLQNFFLMRLFPVVNSRLLPSSHGTSI